jgi:hypothetical protein
VWAEPGVSTKIGFAYFEILTVALDGKEDVLIEATLVKSGLLTRFEENMEEPTIICCPSVRWIPVD